MWVFKVQEIYQLPHTRKRWRVGLLLRATLLTTTVVCIHIIFVYVMLLYVVTKNLQVYCDKSQTD